jgi:UDP-N-acetyl-D-mannosaminuronate dehydrogenase
MKIAVVGLGYVGLPLSLQFARSCTQVIGIDVDPQKVELLEQEPRAESLIRSRDWEVDRPVLATRHARGTGIDDVSRYY